MKSSRSHLATGAGLLLAGAAPFSGGAPGDGTFKAPAPVIESPVNGARFALEPGTSLDLRISLPATPYSNAANIVAFAAASPAEERWHIDVLRRGPGGSEDEASAYAGPLTALRFGENVGRRLTSEWFEQHGGPGPYRIRVYLSQQSHGGALSKGPATSVDFDVVASTKASDGFVKVPHSPGGVKRGQDLNDVHDKPRRITTARLTFVGLPPPGAGGGGGGAGTRTNPPAAASFVFTVPYTITNPAPQLMSFRIRCAVSLGRKAAVLAAAETDVPVGGVARAGKAEIAVTGTSGHNLADARFYSCALKVSDGKMILPPQFGGDIAWARAARGSVSMVSGALGD